MELKNKICLKCGHEKPEQEFNKNASTIDGLDRWCRVCRHKNMADIREKKRKENTGSSPSGPDLKPSKKNPGNIRRRDLPAEISLTKASPEAILRMLQFGTALEIAKDLRSLADQIERKFA